MHGQRKGSIHLLVHLISLGGGGTFNLGTKELHFLHSVANGREGKLEKIHNIYI